MQTDVSNQAVTFCMVDATDRESVSDLRKIATTVLFFLTHICCRTTDKLSRSLVGPKFSFEIVNWDSPNGIMITVGGPPRSRDTMARCAAIGVRESTIIINSQQTRHHFGNYYPFLFLSHLSLFSRT